MAAVARYVTAPHSTLDTSTTVVPEPLIHCFLHQRPGTSSLFDLVFINQEAKRIGLSPDTPLRSFHDPKVIFCGEINVGSSCSRSTSSFFQSLDSNGPEELSTHITIFCLDMALVFCSPNLKTGENFFSPDKDQNCWQRQQQNAEKVIGRSALFECDSVSESRMPLFNSKIRMSLRLYQYKSNKSTTNCKEMHSISPLGGKENNSGGFDNDRDFSLVTKNKIMDASGLNNAKDGNGGRIKTSDLNQIGSTAYPSERSDLLLRESSASSSSSFESCLVDSYSDDFKSYHESYTLDENEASPESKAIMAEMDHIYRSSPVPNSYINSPPKMTLVLPEIVLHTKQISSREEKMATVPKKRMNGGSADRLHATGPSTLETAKAPAYRGSRRSSSIPCQPSGGVSHRRNSTAPDSAGGTSKSHEWDVPTEVNNISVGKGTSSTAIKKKPAALAVQREEQQRIQRLKDATSASNKVDGRRNLDKRTARLRFGDSFKADIMQFRQRHSCLNNGSNHSDKVGSQIQDRGTNGVSIAIRKRPMFDYELDRGDYDIISIDNTNERSHDVTIVHNCVMHADMKQMLMKPIRYPVTAAFDEHACDDDIYRHIAEPLVMNAADQGISTILMYGQTGCGKSHTMSGIETRTSHGLFKAIESMYMGKHQVDRPKITIQFVELCGSKECRDLLVKNSGEVKLLDSEDGSVQLLNAESLEVVSPEELLGQILLAKGRRATEATDKNGVSSRSHAVCQIQIKGKQPDSKRGLLTLIDCAGSERSHDSLYHSR